MLDSLHIENIAVAKNISIEFGSGFNVLTGETGAGKSIIIDSINMLLGKKIEKELEGASSHPEWFKHPVHINPPANEDPFPGVSR